VPANCGALRRKALSEPGKAQQGYQLVHGEHVRQIAFPVSPQKLVEGRIEALGSLAVDLLDYLPRETSSTSTASIS
jgi:hypothetical protein